MDRKIKIFHENGNTSEISDKIYICPVSPESKNWAKIWKVVWRATVMPAFFSAFNNRKNDKITKILKFPQRLCPQRHTKSNLGTV